MAVLMLVTTLLVGLAKQNILMAFQRSAGWIKRASGVVLIVAGLYLGYYYLAAGM
jgi:cytochrome c biogenesis protein CcdA